MSGTGKVWGKAEQDGKEGKKEERNKEKGGKREIRSSGEEVLGIEVSGKGEEEKGSGEGKGPERGAEGLTSPPEGRAEGKRAGAEGKGRGIAAIKRMAEETEERDRKEREERKLNVVVKGRRGGGKEGNTKDWEEWAGNVLRREVRAEWVEVRRGAGVRVERVRMREEKDRKELLECKEEIWRRERVEVGPDRNFRERAERWKAWEEVREVKRLGMVSAEVKGGRVVGDCVIWMGEGRGRGRGRTIEVEEIWEGKARRGGRGERLGREVKREVVDMGEIKRKGMEEEGRARRREERRLRGEVLRERRRELGERKRRTEEEIREKEEEMRELEKGLERLRVRRRAWEEEEKILGEEERRFEEEVE